MRSLTVDPDSSGLATVIAYCEPYGAPWQKTTPMGARVALVLDEGPIVARVSGPGFAPYGLNRRGDEVAADG